MQKVAFSSIKNAHAWSRCRIDAFPIKPSRIPDVFRFNGAYLFNFAVAMKPLGSITLETTVMNAFMLITPALNELNTFLQYTPLALKSTMPVAARLASVLTDAQAKLFENQGAPEDKVEYGVVSALQIAYNAFEETFKSEMAIANLYWVTKKGAYDVTVLAEYGEEAFPPELTKKIPKVEYDAKQAARCIAFDLPTAAAFHLHRVHEHVVQVYFKAVAPSITPPSMRSLEHWIKAIEALPGYDKPLVAAIRDINNLHRNPVLHPEHTLTDVNDAMGLLGAVNTSIQTMLKSIS